MAAARVRRLDDPASGGRPRGTTPVSELLAYNNMLR